MPKSGALPWRRDSNQKASGNPGAVQFGEDRAWSRTAIFNFWFKVYDETKGRPSRIGANPELRDFVEDRLGRFTLKELVAACRNRFGAAAPSKSAIHRHADRLRRRKGRGVKPRKHI